MSILQTLSNDKSKKIQLGFWKTLYYNSFLPQKTIETAKLATWKTMYVMKHVYYCFLFWATMLQVFLSYVLNSGWKINEKQYLPLQPQKTGDSWVHLLFEAGVAILSATIPKAFFTQVLRTPIFLRNSVIVLSKNSK